MELASLGWLFGRKRAASSQGTAVHRFATRRNECARCAIWGVSHERSRHGTLRRAPKRSSQGKESA